MTASLSYPDYPVFLAALKARVLQARTSAARAVNRDMILLYWDIGRSIVEKQQKAGWGESVVERLAADLRAAFPDMRGFSVANMWRMKQFYLAHSTPEFLAQAVRELGPVPQSTPEPEFLAQVVRELVATVPWGHHVVLLGKLADPAARLYYLRATARFGWSRNVLLHQIKAQAYERAVLEKKAHNFESALPEYLAEQADEMMKSRYNLEFYLNLLNDTERGPDDQPSIGIILCTEKDDVEVEYALRTKQNPIGVAEYQLQPRLPAEFKGRLPTARQLADVVRGAKEEG